MQFTVQGNTISIYYYYYYSLKLHIMCCFYIKIVMFNNHTYKYILYIIISDFNLFIHIHIQDYHINFSII